MPEKNEACTARTMSVIDNDNATTKKAHIIRQNGAKEVVEIDSKDVLDRINNDEDIKEFLIETDIETYQEEIGVNGIKFYGSLHKKLKDVDICDFMDAVGAFGRGIGSKKLQKVITVK